MKHQFEQVRRPREVPSRRPGPRSPSGPGHWLLDLQHAAGNAAVQRAIEYATYHTNDPDRIRAAIGDQCAPRRPLRLGKALAVRVRLRGPCCLPHWSSWLVLVHHDGHYLAHV